LNDLNSWDGMEGDHDRKRALEEIYYCQISKRRKKYLEPDSKDEMPYSTRRRLLAQVNQNNILCSALVWAALLSLDNNCLVLTLS
jgi:hypothetical protein